MAIINTPIPQDKIGECFVWRDWFQRLSNAVFGSMAGQNSNNVSITGGDIHANTLSVGSGLDGQVLIGKSLDHSFTPAYLTAGKGIGITNAPASVTLRNTGVTSVIAGTGIAVSSATGDVTISQTSATTKSYGAFHDTTTQTSTAATIKAITFNATDLSVGVSRGTPTSKIVVTNAGIYNIQFSAEISNPSAAIDDVTIWIRQNGVDLSNSAGIVGAPPKHDAINGHTIIGWNYILQAAANDYFELYWITDNGTTQILTYPASTTPPIHPQAPSVIITVQQV